MRIIFILLFACFTSWSAKSYASTWDEGRWIVCNTCQSELQFQQAAVNMHGSATHPAIYAVGNFESTRFKYVIIYPRRHPEAPALVNAH